MVILIDKNKNLYKCSCGKILKTNKCVFCNSVENRLKLNENIVNEVKDMDNILKSFVKKFTIRGYYGK